MRNTAAHEITLIQIGRSALELDEPTYRLMLSNLTGGKTSSKQLTPSERQAVLNHMKACGFKIKPKAGETGWRREPQMRKLRAMWYMLAEAGEVEQPSSSDACDAAIEVWAKRQLAGSPEPLAALRFANGEQMNALIEAMKAWGRRVGAHIE